ncbi:hypothetical protein DMB66_46345 [Actinoplanes sp. ATCC 53533]|uniref:hypothetical protein n=1 Tax=Actinoplanes sp. ATCC 53533 TaxID=1288362 RepID=UPI000F768200|nr:hypothetical protein [Actinoplanes sp. ATCC 53533]RSM48402.1 hypothetical protein DMB66_46345 [Actinoplanes sp. ATCC 53533]
MAQIQFPNVLFSPGTFNATIVDNSGAPASVLEAGAPFRIDTDWSVDALTALLLGGEWTVTAYVESVGPGPEQEIGTTTLAVNGGQNYAATVAVPANTLPNPPIAPTSGIYKVVTVLTHRNFGTPSNVAAVVEGPVLRIA